MKKLHVLMLLLTASVLLAGCQDSSDSPGFDKTFSSENTLASDDAFHDASVSENQNVTEDSTGLEESNHPKTSSGSEESMLPETSSDSGESNHPETSSGSGVLSGGTETSGSLNNDIKTSSSFRIEGEKGSQVLYNQSSNSYTITTADTYDCYGNLSEGQIVISAADDAEITLNLNGCTITNSSTSPICILTAGEVDISAKKDTVNQIYDLRNGTDSTDDLMGNAAVYAECDLTIKGNGALEVVSNYNNGIHTKDDLMIRNLTLTVKAVNHAVKGNDSITIESGTITAISTGGDALKTSSTDTSKKGNQRGVVEIQSGTVTLYAARDGIDGASDVIIGDAEVAICTDTYSPYSETTTVAGNLLSYTPIAAFGRPGIGGGRGGMGGGSTNTEKTDYSCKGIKAGNTITISGGTITISSKDDALHANFDEILESTGQKGLGNIHISGGSLTLSSGDDAIHADQDLIIDGGTINILTSYEGLEANRIYISDGSVTAYARDDGINANSKGSYTAYVEISGGYLDVTVPSGDTDTLDSNGSVLISGGFVFLKNGQSGGSNMGGGTLDTDRGVTVTGGTVIAIGCICNKISNSVYSTSLSFDAGNYSIKSDTGKEVAAFSLSASYKACMFWSDQFASGQTYSIYQDNSVLAAFTI